MSITVGENTARSRWASPARDADEWAAYTHGQAVESIDNGWFDDQIVPVECPTRDGGTATFSVDEHPRPWHHRSRRSAPLKPAPPRDRGRHHHRGQRGRPQRRRRRGRPHLADYAAAHGLTPARPDRVVGVGPASSPAAPGMGPTLAIPKALDRGRAVDRRHRPVRDQRGVLLGADRRHRTLGHRPHDRERQRQRLQPRPPDRGHRRPHGRHHDPRAAPPRPDSAVVSMCAGGGMGSAPVLELLL